MHGPVNYVYILTNALRTVLYTGVTNNLKRRLLEHYKQRGATTSFCGQFNAHYLLYFEGFPSIIKAIKREKEIKAWRREKKLKLIATMNPSLQFLNTNFFREWPPPD